MLADVPFETPPPDTLRQLREELGLSQAELAAELGFTKNGAAVVRGWEAGKRNGIPCAPTPLAWRCLRLIVVLWRATRVEKNRAWDYAYDNLPERLR